MKYILCCFLTLLLVNGHSQNTFPSTGNVGIGTTTSSDLTHPITIKPTAGGLGIQIIAPNPNEIDPWTTNTLTIAKNAVYAYIYEMNTQTRLDLHGGHQLFLFADDIFFEGNAVVTRKELTNPTSMGASISSGTMPFEINMFNSSTGNGNLKYAGIQNIASLSQEGQHRLAFIMNSFQSSLYQGKEVLSILSNGSVGINLDVPDTKNHALAVNGSGIFTKLYVKPYPWPDYVFNKSYKLPALTEVEKFIKKNKHLPEIPSASAVLENGIDLGNNQTLLLKKIEELTLYMIEQNKRLNSQEAEIRKLQKQLSKLK